MKARRALAVLQRFMSDPPCVPPDLAQAIRWLEAQGRSRAEPEPPHPRLTGRSSSVVEKTTQPGMAGGDEATVHNARKHVAIGSQGPPRWAKWYRLAWTIHVRGARITTPR